MSSKHEKRAAALRLLIKALDFLSGLKRPPGVFEGNLCTKGGGLIHLYYNSTNTKTGHSFVYMGSKVFI